jgi:hypothetical protein
MVNTKVDTTRWPEDSTRISLSEKTERHYWSRRFHVSPGKLEEAVRAVSPKFKDVSHFLSYRRP